MKKLLFLTLLIPSFVFAQTTLFPNRGGTGISTPPSYGQVLLGNSLNGYTLTATSSLGITSGTLTSVTASSPLTGGTITTSGSIGCQTASGSQAGCLSLIDWTTFSNKTNWATTSTDYWKSVTDLFSTTSANYWKTTTNFFSTTSADYWGGTKGYLTSLAGAASSTLLSDTNSWSGKNTFTYASTTQLTTTGSTYLATTGGNVGIGTTSPSYPLEVVNQIGVTSVGTSNSSLRIATGDGAADWSFTTNGITGLFSFYNFKTNKNPINISTTAPNSSLNLNTSNVSSSNPFLSTNNTTQGTNYGQNQISNQFIGQNFLISSSETLGFQTYSGSFKTRAFITNVGNFGIGTTTPVANLQVTDAVNATTTLEIGRGGSNKGSCIKLYDSIGTAWYYTPAVGTGALTSASAVSCASVTGF